MLDALAGEGGHAPHNPDNLTRRKAAMGWGNGRRSSYDFADPRNIWS
jgi:hypothetical protein